MKSKSLIGTTCLLIAGVIATGSMFAAQLVIATPQAVSGYWERWTYQTEASMLLMQVQSTATPLTRDAAILQSFARGGISRESHIDRVNLVKDHINVIGKQLARLQAIRHMAAPWQRQAIDAVVPIAVNLASRTEAAIQHLSERKPLWSPDYSNHLRVISERSDRLKEAINLHLEMAETQEQLELLRDRSDRLGS